MSVPCGFPERGLHKLGEKIGQWLMSAFLCVICLYNEEYKDYDQEIAKFSHQFLCLITAATALTMLIWHQRFSPLQCSCLIRQQNIQYNIFCTFMSYIQRHFESFVFDCSLVIAVKRSAEYKLRIAAMFCYFPRKSVSINNNCTLYQVYSSVGASVSLASEVLRPFSYSW